MDAEHTPRDTQAYDGDYPCSHAINQIILGLPSKGSLFYLITNGLYLGQYGDYASCKLDATDAQFVTATVTGDYVGTYSFDRGVFGKYIDALST